MKQLYVLVLMPLLFGSFTQVQSNEPVDIQTRTVQFYPNPATSVIYFDFPSTFNKSSNLTLYIFSFIGKKMEEVPVNASKIAINLDNYFRGLYIFQIRDKNGSIIESGKFQVIK
jgi:hypothetical protein